jgi:hypothetical protein
MKFRTGLVIGLGVGFVLGARAGRERYDQMRRVARRVVGDERLRQAAAAAERTTRPARAAAGNGMVYAGEKVKDRVVT